MLTKSSRLEQRSLRHHVGNSLRKASTQALTKAILWSLPFGPAPAEAVANAAGVSIIKPEALASGM
jgi:hypothetical protein